MDLIQAELFRVDDVIYGVPYVRAPGVIFTASGTNVTEVGTKALEVLAASAAGERPNIFFSREALERSKLPLLRASGYASLDAFEAAAQYIFLDHSNQDFVILPSRRNEPGAGYSHYHVKKITFQAKDARELGVAIVRAFSLCEDYISPVIAPGIDAALLGLAVPHFEGLHPQTIDKKPEFVVSDGTPALSFIELLSWLPSNCELNYFDPNYPQISDPGAYVSVVKHGEGLAMFRGNHGWSSGWELQTADVIAELLRRSTDALAIEKGGQAKIEIRRLPGRV
jgi:hypothetical protein